MTPPPTHPPPPQILRQLHSKFVAGIPPNLGEDTSFDDPTYVRDAQYVLAQEGGDKNLEEVMDEQVWRGRVANFEWTQHWVSST